MSTSNKPIGATNQLTFALESPRRIFAVSELNATVGGLIDAEFRNIFVSGEISGCRGATSGHYYFALKDARSQIKCALFRGAARFVRFVPQDGMAVIARGNLEVYQARGEYQLIVESLEPQGAGALQLAFEQLKKQLQAEGLFEQARKRPLPRLPQRIGIVTSPTGAVIRDILHVLERRFAGLQIRLYPAQVQGEGSVAQVCRGLDYFSDQAWAQVVILARGGGSLEDLWTFNEEEVARAIARSTVPVISAIGHETDFTIADFVADVRAPTPSAAAEIVICTRVSLVEQVDGCRSKMGQLIRYRLLASYRTLEGRGTDRVIHLMQRALTRRAQRLDELDDRARATERQMFDRHRKRLKALDERLVRMDIRLRLLRISQRRESAHQQLARAAQELARRARQRYERQQVQLTQLSPLRILSRGYSIAEDANGRVIRSADEVAAGSAVRVLLGQGEFEAEVTRSNAERRPREGGDSV